MTKRISRLLSMLLAAVMVLSMAMAGLAAEVEPMLSSTDEEFTIIVTNAADGETYRAYKIFDVTYSDEDSEGNGNYSYTINNDSAWYSIVAAATDVFTLIQVNGSTTYIVTVNEGVEDDAIIAVFTKAGVPEGAVPDATTTASGNEYYGYEAVLDVTNSGAGYYYVTTSLGSLVIIDTTNPSQEIEEKNGIPTTKKYVDDSDYESVENEKTFEYEIKVPNVKGVLNLVIEDAMNVTIESDGTVGDTFDEGVTYEFNYYELTVTLIDGTDEIELEKDTDYILNTEPNDGCDFHIIFAVEDENYDFSNCSSEAYIQVRVSCTIYAEGYNFADDEIEIPNNARVTYGDVSKSEWDEADVYEYGFEIFKYDADDTPLADAEFQLSRTADDGSTEYAIFDKNSNGQYVLTGWASIESEATRMVTDDTGYIYVEGLATGEYTLTEIKAPDGYNMLADPLIITIANYEDDPGKFDVFVGEDEDTKEATDHIVKVLNQAGTLLPGTGGMGTTLFYIVGVVLILGAAVLFVTKKRLDKEQ